MTWDAALESLNDSVLDTFGEDVTLAGAAIRGVYEEGYVEVTGGEVGFESSRPALSVRTEDLTGAPHGLAVVRKGVSHIVVGVQPDDGGMTRLILEAQ